MNDDAARASPPTAPRRATGWLRRWVAFWDEREPPTCLALIRIALGLVIVFDLLTLAAHGAIDWIWTPVEAGGVAGGDDAEASLFYLLVPASAGSAMLLWAGLLASAVGVAVGAFTRTSALVHVWFSVQAAVINPGADRAIDRLIRMVLIILVLAPSAAVWSVDAKRATGSFRGDASPAPAWPRYLIFGQLVLTYFGAGLAKGGTYWYPWGGYNALYLTLRDPILSSVEPGWLDSTLAHVATQIGTAATHLWELGAPLLLLAAYQRRTSERGGRRRLFGRVPVRDVYVAIGVVFHLSLALSLRLGIFPFAMLACFPAFFRPDELGRAWSSAVAASRRLAAKFRTAPSL
ncbi:MAG TPA: HTTM domain-containing protein [Polyangiaceae bacterium]|nr:HTTM domain-containing protein [Polyangiaceae bacterium]